jgi:hypothetical protein
LQALDGIDLLWIEGGQQRRSERDTTDQQEQEYAQEHGWMTINEP